MRRCSVEADIAARFDRSNCVLVGRATTGLALALEALDVDGDVFYPAYMCPSPAYAALYANATPRFCDVREDYTMDPADLERAVTDETDAIVPVHMFGHPADMESIEEIAAANEAAVIEDACQSIGAMPGGAPLGSHGTVSVVSFGDGKPIDAGGGGAVLTDDEALAKRIRDLEADVPVRDNDRLEELYDHYRDVYYAIEDLGEVTDEAYRLFKPFPEVFQELYMRGTTADLPNRVATALSGIDEEAAVRKMNADSYRSELDDDRITHPEPLDGTIYYRYSVRMPSKEVRDYIVDYLRNRDIHVSTLYDTIHRRFGSDAAAPIAERLSRETLNLWVTSEVDEEYVLRCCENVQEALTEYESND